LRRARRAANGHVRRLSATDRTRGAAGRRSHLRRRAEPAQSARPQGRGRRRRQRRRRRGGGRDRRGGRHAERANEAAGDAAEDARDFALAIQRNTRSPDNKYKQIKLRCLMYLTTTVAHLTKTTA